MAIALAICLSLTIVVGTQAPARAQQDPLPQVTQAVYGGQVIIVTGGEAAQPGVPANSGAVMPPQNLIQPAPSSAPTTEMPVFSNGTIAFLTLLIGTLMIGLVSDKKRAK